MSFIQLVDAGQALSHAALSADFGSYAQCHRVFRRFLGCAPTDYFAGARRRIDATVLPEAQRATSNVAFSRISAEDAPTRSS